MAGIHTVYRRTNQSNVISAFSRLILPSNGNYGCKDNISDLEPYGGGFPEFFHGFYDSSWKGFDAGVLYSKGKWRAFVNPTADPNHKWAESLTGFSIPTNREIAIRTYLQGDYLIVSILNSSNVEIDKCHYYLGSFKYLLQSGSYFHREMTIAVNPEKSGAILSPKAAFYRDASFKNSSITLVGGSTVALSSSNSNITNNGKVDPGTPTNTYDDKKSSTSLNGYVHDTSSATFYKTVYPV